MSTRRLAAVFFADVVGFTRLSSEDEPAALRLLEVLRKVSVAEIGRHGGRVVKFLGDGVLAEFPSTEGAVQSAIALQRAFAAGASADGDPALLRIGVHVGDVASGDDGDIHGDGVNVAARLASAAEPGQVLVSEDVWRQLRPRPEFRFAAQGERELKGITARVGVFSVGLVRGPTAEHPPHPEGAEDGHGASPEPPRSGALRAPPSRRAALYAATALLGLLVLAVAWFAYSRQSDGVGAVAGAEPSGADTSRVASIAVLPFENLSSDPDNAHYADGITEEILTTLNEVRGLRVTGRVSVMQYKGTTKSARDIGAELGVGNLLGGSIQRAGDSVRIQVRLIDAESQALLWAQRYDRPFGDILIVQSEIAMKIAGMLQSELTATEMTRMGRRPTTDLVAFDLVLRGRELYNHLVAEDNEEAIRLFRRALERDSAYVDALVGLSDAYRQKGQPFGGGPAWEDSAVVVALRAIAIDRNSAYAWEALGWAHNYQERDRESLEAYRTAARLNPDLTGGLGDLYYNGFGRYDEAIRLLKNALRANPVDPFLLLTAARQYHALRMYDQAQQLYERTLEVQPTWNLAYAGLGNVLLQRGRPRDVDALIQRMLSQYGETPRALNDAGRLAAEMGEARRARGYYERAITLTGQPSEDVYLAWVYRQEGEEERAKEILRRVAAQPGWRSPYQKPGNIATLARLRLLEGKREEALDQLEIAVGRGWRGMSRGVWGVSSDPILKSLRGDPRFERLVAQVKADIDRQRERVVRAGW